MQPVTQVSGTAYPWGQKNVDTDVIIPARYLNTNDPAVLVDGALEDHRDPPVTAPTSSGVATWPASADAAATYGLAR